MKRQSAIGGMLLFFLCAAAVYPQNETGTAGETTTIAVVPFKGSPANIINDFGDVLQQELPNAGPYSQYLVDMNNLPPDVPEGGFPPYVCPSPSMTNNAPYALTGEVTPDADDPSSYHLRLYLWEMENNRLVFSDELTAPDKESCAQSLPSLLTWILSWIKPDDTPKTAAAAPQTPASQPAAAEPEKWLYLGLRTGPSLRFYNRTEAFPFLERQVMHYWNIAFAFQAAVHLLPWLDIQAESIFSTDYVPFTYYYRNAARAGALTFDTNGFNFMSLMFPLLARFNIRRGPLMAGLLAGPYFFLPLGMMESSIPDEIYGGKYYFNMKLPLGYTAGFNVGMKLGPGYLFTDVRWTADIGEIHKTTGDLPLFRRSGVSLNIGYEFGLLAKKKKAASAEN